MKFVISSVSKIQIHKKIKPRLSTKIEIVIHESCENFSVYKEIVFLNMGINEKLNIIIMYKFITKNVHTGVNT